MAKQQHIGWARVGIDQAHIAASVRLLTREGSIYALLAIGLGVLCAWVIARRLTRVLQRLTEVAIRIRSGEKAARVGMHRQDELGLLALTFDQMLDALEAADRGSPSRVSASWRAARPNSPRCSAPCPWQR